MIAIILGVVALVAGLAIVVVVLLEKPRTAAAAAASDLGVHDADVRSLHARTVDATDRAMKQRGWSPVSAEQLELAGVKASPASYVVSLMLASAAAAVIGLLLGVTQAGLLAVMIPVLLVLAVLVGSGILLRHRIARRQAAFADQLDDTLQLITSGLRAGHSLARAIAAVSHDAESPTREEFARISNEHRLGRDLGTALLNAAERMKSDDLAWAAQAVDIHREVGGNLSEVLDHVAETIRERNQLRRQIATLSSEGRLSANVLLGLPVLVAVVLTLISPNYLSVFVAGPLGFALIAVCLVLFIVGMVWLRSVVKIRF